MLLINHARAYTKITASTRTVFNSGVFILLRGLGLIKRVNTVASCIFQTHTYKFVFKFEVYGHSKAHVIKGCNSLSSKVIGAKINKMYKKKA